MIPKFANKTVICIGEVLWDNFPDVTVPGGAMLNIAHHLHTNNIPVTLVSKVGTDSKGIELLGHMKETGLNTEAIYFDDTLSTSEVDINIDKYKKIRYDVHEPVAWDNLQINMRIVDHAGSAGAIIYDSLASRNKVTRKTIEVLLSLDIVKIMNVNLRPSYDNREIVESLLLKADIVKLNENELDQILGWHNKVFTNEKDKLKWFSENFNCNIICVTKGNNGAVIYNNGILLSHPGFKSKTVDNVGTGAAFLAGFISSLIDEKSIQQSLDVACATSALIASSKGALLDDSIHDKNEIYSNINKIKTNLIN